ncbi:MAG: cobalamin biosynthesis protein CobD [Bacteroidaceae bacterium]|nr:cobalamin biosynthesis protein CobD [Bacteroidaceae bacterium]
MTPELLLPILILLLAAVLDRLLGDPQWLPHPVVGFGKLIALGEHCLNKGSHRRLKGGILAISLTLLTFLLSYGLLRLVPIAIGIPLQVILIFFCLAGTTLIREVREVFRAVDQSVELGRTQVARIVGRDTSELSAQEIRTAALETLAENLSDGVVAPLFWLAMLGVPGMLTYKMVNTLDSMIGYRTERYRRFGTVAARIDDVANWLPARLTAWLMTICAGRPGLWSFIRRYGRAHASPNSGYPESALAGILDCRFGGPHHYFGELISKPYIGQHDKMLRLSDMLLAVSINRRVEAAMLLLVALRYVVF